MKTITLVRGETYTLVPTLFKKGEQYTVTDEVADYLLSQRDSNEVAYFEEVNSSSPPKAAEVPPEEKKPTAGKGKIVI